MKWLFGLATAICLGAYIKVGMVEDLMLDYGYGILIASLLSGVIAGLALYLGASLLLLGSGFALTPFFSKQYFRAHRAYGYIAIALLAGGFSLAQIPFGESPGNVSSLFEGLELGFQPSFLYAGILVLAAIVLQTMINRTGVRKRYWAD